MKMFRGDELVKISGELVEFIRNVFRSFSAECAVIGLSGGIDSAVVFKLLIEALGSERILAVILPELTTPRSALRDAMNLAKSHGVKTIKKNISPMMFASGAYFKLEMLSMLAPQISRWLREKFEKEVVREDIYLHTLKTSKNKWVARGTSLYRMKHRLRMIMLYYFAERTNGLVVGTANRSEYLTGFFVKHGDGAADLMPIIELYKTEIFELAEILHVPQSIIKRPPSPDLIPGVTDEYALGIDYTALDLILEALVDHQLGLEEAAKETGISLRAVERVKKILDMSSAMRVPFISPGLRRDGDVENEQRSSRDDLGAGDHC
ncbi:MAG TPA: NAD(+) synthase [Thermotogae bacterium]|nr:NAD(+) synthase [Thermotogota bacterium]